MPLPTSTSTILSKKDDGVRSGRSNSGSGNSGNSGGSSGGSGNGSGSGSGSGSSKTTLLPGIVDSPGKGGVGAGNKGGSGSGGVNKGVKFTLSATSREEGAGGAGGAATTVVGTNQPTLLYPYPLILVILVNRWQPN